MEEEEQFEILKEAIAVPPPPIEDPWYSRPIDVHRWSDHPELAGLAERLWVAYCFDMERKASSPGPRPKTSFRHQFRVLLLDLYVAWLEDPRLCIGVAMSVNYWDTTSRYNALNISKQIIPIVKRLTDVGLLDLARGSYAGPTAITNRTTRIRGSKALRDMFQSLTATRDDVKRIESEECIILREGLVVGDGTKIYDYKDTDETNRMRDELRAYNKVLVDAFIDIPSLDEPVVQRTDQFGKVFIQPLDHHHHFVRRVFSRGSWQMNGRFYGAWWQLIPSDLRRGIYINDTPTVEVDFKGLHVSLLSAEQGVAMEGDPYTLDGLVIPGVPAALQRSLVKQLVLTALNAKDRKSAFQSFRDGWPANHYGKGMLNEELSVLLDAFTGQHPHLKELVCADQGIRLMNVDSRIAERVHYHFTRQDVPVLSVHDSFFIDYTRVGELKQVMAEASTAVVGRPMAVSASGLGVDEVEPDFRLDFVGWAQLPRSPAYLRRMSAWEARLGWEVIPYR
ncbi:MAG: hypothetical protein WCO04_00140 [Pseudomonadota bacterium]